MALLRFLRADPARLPVLKSLGIGGNDVDDRTVLNDEGELGQERARCAWPCRPHWLTCVACATSDGHPRGARWTARVLASGSSGAHMRATCPHYSRRQRGDRGYRCLLFVSNGQEDTTVVVPRLRCGSWPLLVAVSPSPSLWHICFAARAMASHGGDTLDFIDAVGDSLPSERKERERRGSEETRGGASVRGRRRCHVWD